MTDRGVNHRKLARLRRSHERLRPRVVGQRARRLQQPSTEDASRDAIPNALSPTRCDPGNLGETRSEIDDTPIVLAGGGAPTRYRLLIEDRYPEVVVPAGAAATIARSDGRKPPRR
jgi:hypothetical protein